MILHTEYFLENVNQNLWRLMCPGSSIYGGKIVRYFHNFKGIQVIAAKLQLEVVLKKFLATSNIV